VEFIFSLPPDFKIRNGWSKWLLRKSVSGKLPDEITWRRNKIGFEPPQKDWMMNPRVQEAIHAAKQKLVQEDILKKEVLEKKIIPRASHEDNNYDWRYLSSALLFK
jgi:asparagine synthase (glutamine-hydrolysing)